jgi:hypothetical protein
MAGKQTNQLPPLLLPIDDGVNNSFSRIDDCIVAVLVVQRIDSVVVRNDKTDPDLPRAVDCPANESKGGAVAELAARNASNPSNGGRLLAARAVASPFPNSPKVQSTAR